MDGVLDLVHPVLCLGFDIGLLGEGLDGVADLRARLFDVGADLFGRAGTLRLVRCVAA
jgi:hypothetical protein